MDAEIAARRAGSQTVLAKLSELLFVEAVRRYVETLPAGETGWLAGLKDPYVSRGLGLIHGAVSKPWTVDMLGREVGLSRSVLADRFARLIGEPPMRYLAHWRIQVAAHQLRTSDVSLARIAAQIGYESEAAFNRAFKRSFGVPPATWRKTRQPCRPNPLPRRARSGQTARPISSISRRTSPGRRRPPAQSTTARRPTLSNRTRALPKSSTARGSLYLCLPAMPAPAVADAHAAPHAGAPAAAPGLHDHVGAGVRLQARQRRLGGRRAGGASHRNGQAGRHRQA
jgi:AraC-like DNA-binding protein